MSLSFIYQQITRSSFCRQVVSWAQADDPTPLRLRGVPGSLPAFVLHHLMEETNHQILCILPEKEDALYLHADVEQFASGRVLLFPPSGRTPYDEEQIADFSLPVERADVLQQLRAGLSGVLVTSLEALYERVPSLSLANRETFEVSIGLEVAPQTLVTRLAAQGFQRTEFVEQPGDVAWRGGILDVYPFVGQYPVRIEFFGDEIDSIREFDSRSQRSISRLTQARIVPDLTGLLDTEPDSCTLFDYMAPNAVLALFNAKRFEKTCTDLFERASSLCGQSDKPGLSRPETHYAPYDELRAAMDHKPQLLLGSFMPASDGDVLDMAGRPQPSFNGHISEVKRQLAENNIVGTRTTVLCDSLSQKDRLAELLEDEVHACAVELVTQSLHEGFVLPELGLAVYTDHQIFNRFHRPSSRRRRRHGGIRIQELRNLQPGDFIVHVDYGVGRFAGFRTITVRNRRQEAVRIHYADEDVLFVNVQALHKLHRYTGKDGHVPRLTKLGSGQWERAKKRAKKRIKDIARDLILLYARRKASKGYGFSADTVWQREMEASFAFEDTPDQALVAEAIKRDMETPTPMDRLICGDVGFGKTEVAVRAAFKAVQDGKQVAILVPTTVLAQQHYETFRQRLNRYPVRVDVLSRFKAPAEQKRILADLKTGAVDIVVGTHRLVSRDVAFNDLGLLIVDEEQRFGVGVKERLRQTRVNVDTITLTATPIPRTLQFSLMGARDLSIISTPPPNRQRILTEIHSFNKNLIRDAILYETGRGGQVFVIHNRVQSIEEFASMLRALVPGVRMDVAHGQMKPARLEQVMMSFIARKFDVLVSTTIIENGLDISNANTIVIHQAQRFGLSELHQLRGRVGRSQRKAFCYLLVPSIHALTRTARRRLQAVEEFSDLGSGFQIAMRDMDIRGAGNVLGGEQSGFIAEVGYETYLSILDEAVEELRHEEFSTLFEDLPPRPAAEPTIDLAMEALLPESYVSNHLERLSLYRRLGDIDKTPHLEELCAELRDRFGPLPREAANLLAGAAIKLAARELRLPRVQVKSQRLFLHFPAPEVDEHFHEHIYRMLLERLADGERRYVLKEIKDGSLCAIVQAVADLQDAQRVIEQLSYAPVAP